MSYELLNKIHYIDDTVKDSTLYIIEDVRQQWIRTKEDKIAGLR